MKKLPKTAGRLPQLRPALNGLREYFPAGSPPAALLADVTETDFDSLKSDRALGVVGMTSGYFAPGHPGHYELVRDSAGECDALFVVVNGDPSLELKHGYCLMPLPTRAALMTEVLGADFVVPAHLPNDSTMAVPLKLMKPDLFLKGGDRNLDNMPLAELTASPNTQLVSGVGGDFKMASSSDFIKTAARFIRENSTALTIQDKQPAHPFKHPLQNQADPEALRQLLDRNINPLDLEHISANRQALADRGSNTTAARVVPEPAPVVTVAEFLLLRRRFNLGRVAHVSGDFAPLLPIALNQLRRLKESYDTVVVLVRPDQQIAAELVGLVFQGQALRSQSLQYFRCIDFVIPLDEQNQVLTELSATQPQDTTDAMISLADGRESRALLLLLAAAVRANPRLFQDN